MDFFSIAGIDPHKLLKTQVNELVVKLKAFEIENTKLKDTVSEFDLKLVGPVIEFKSKYLFV